MNQTNKKDLELFRKHEKVIIKTFTKIINGEKFSAKEIKKIGKVRTEIKFRSFRE